MKKAPDFSLPDQDGTIRNLSDYRGKWVVLYFYPKDDTPGCTTEACNFRDQRDEIEASTGAVVVGVSKDTVESHKKFALKHRLNFTLLSDTDHKVIEAYGSWKERKFMGKEFMGTMRNTFVIDPDGNIAKEYKGVDPRSHADQIMEDLSQLQSVSA